MKNREDIVFDYLNDNNIPYTCYHHPEGKTIEEAKQKIKQIINNR